MPYTLPNYADLKTRYSLFCEVDDDLIDSVIAEASRNVDESWSELDYQPAILALAAHMLVEEGATGRSVEFAGAITSSKLGDGQDTYSGLTAAQSAGEYSSTSFGRKFMQLRAQNCQGVVLL